MPSISEILKSRIGSKPNTSKAFIASKLGVSEKTVENYINGKRNPKPDALVQLSQLLDFSLDEMSEQNVRDLTDGNSNLTLVHRDIEVVNGDKQDHFLKQRQQQKLLDKWHGVPMYDAPITASFIETYRDERIYHPKFYLHDDRFRDCDFGAVIKGDSMHPEIRHGDFVVCREVKDFGFIVYGEKYYVISTNDLETCKYLHPGKTDDEFLLKAYNKNVPDNPLPKKYLRRLFKVRGILRSY